MAVCTAALVSFKPKRKVLQKAVYILQVTQYYMSYSGEDGLPEGEEERHEKLNDLLDDPQVRLPCSTSPRLKHSGHIGPTAQCMVQTTCAILYPHHMHMGWHCRCKKSFC